MNILFSEYGGDKFSAGKINRIRSFVIDLSRNEFERIIDRSIDDYNYAPKPSFFREMALEAKRKSNFKSYAKPLLDTERVFYCHDCMDGATVEVSVDGVVVLAICDCNYPERKPRDFKADSFFWSLPIVDRSQMKVLSKWPERYKEMVPQKFNQLQNYAKLHRERIKIAQQFWAQ
jgi:hypothetical protein